MSLKVVFKPSSEIEAEYVRKMLEYNGIYCIVKSFQIPWFDGISKVMRPEWGSIEVREEDYDKAKRLIEEFLKDLEKAHREDE